MVVNVVLTLLFVFCESGPEEEREPPTEETYSELKATRKERREIRQREKEAARTAAAQVETNCNWGMAEDAQEVTDVNPYADLEPLHEERYRDDPKRALRQWCVREGHAPPQFEFPEAGFGKQHCRVELPLLDDKGQPLLAEVVVSGKRREALVACALEACTLLDKMGQFESGGSGAGRRRDGQGTRDWEAADFYDSDEDSFLDRTGQLEAKRLARMRRAGAKETPPVDNFDTLCEKLKVVQKEIASLEDKLAQSAAQITSAQTGNSELDELEAYMRAVKAGALDRQSRLQLKMRLMGLRKEEARFMRLANKARPAHLPPLHNSEQRDAVIGMRKVGKKLPSTIQTRQFHEKVVVADTERDDEDDEKHEMGEKKVNIELPMETLVDDSNVSNVKNEVEKCCQIESESRENTTELKRKHDIPLGPDRPLDWSSDEKALVQDTSFSQVDMVSEDQTTKTKTKRAKRQCQLPEDYDHSNPAIAMWLPPTNQTGDGETALNKKFGY